MPRRIWLLGLAVTAVGAVLRLCTLGFPGDLVFDEVYYANDARVYLDGVDAYNHQIGSDPAKPPAQPPLGEGLLGEQTWVHPPLGKWAIAVGEAAAGQTSPWGRRISPAVLGTATVALVYLIGLEVLPGPGWAFLAALFAALDGMLVVVSRVGLLDGPLTFFVVLGAWCVARDRAGAARPRWGGWWRLGAGTAFGAAVAVKWSGAMALAIGAALVLAWAVDARRLRAEWPGVALAFVAVPMLVYLVSYGAWFGQHGLHLGRFAALQHDMAQYHATLTQGHLYQANPWGWLLLLRPTALYFTGGETIHHILAVGNPALWWPSIPALAVVVVMAARPARWDARFVAAFALGQYVPWLGVSRLTFLYYMTPVVPFLALGLVMAIAAVPRPARTAVAAVATALVSLAAAFFLPLWIGYGVSSAYWQRLMIFRSWI